MRGPSSSLRSRPASTSFVSVRYTVARLTSSPAFFIASISPSASKCLCWLKMNRTMSRCCSVNRCGRGRLVRYSRNLSSGLCDTLTAGRDTRPSSPSVQSIMILDYQYTIIARLAQSTSAENDDRPGGRPVVSWHRGPSSAHLESLQESAQGRLQLLGRIVGARRDLLSHPGDQ